MALASLFAASTFRTAVYGSAVLVAALVVSGVTVFSTLRTTLDEDVRNQVESARAALIEVYAAEGRDTFLDHVRRIALRLGAWRQAIVVYDTQGQRLAGNIAIPPPPEGWHEIDDPALTVAVSYPRILANVSVLGDFTVLSGRSLQTRDVTLRTLAYSVSGLALLVMITFIGIGIVLGSRAQRRLSSIGAALERVSLGDLSARVPVDFGIDATDKLAGQINNQLARLESLISLTRATSATLAHELRSPLARATLAIERAADAAESDRAKQALGEVEAELARIAAVFDSVLRIARIGSQPSLDSGHIEPAALLAELVEIFGPVAEERGIKLELAAPDDSNLLRGDVSMLRQMVANLIENALAYCPAGATITLSAEPRSGGRVALVVADTGPGIPEEERSRVTEPFYRGDADKANRGTGLGLSIVQAIVARHGARLELLDNRPGLRVVVEFPPAGQAPA